MRILFVCGAGVVYGKEIITLSLIEGLRARGHEVRCLTSSWGSKEFARRLDSNGTIWVSLPLGFISKTLSWSAVRMTLHQIAKLPKLWTGYRRLLLEFKPDVVVQNNFHHIFLLYPLLNLRKTVFHVHDNFATTTFYRQVFKVLCRRICIFAGVSRFVADTLLSLELPQSSVTYVLNGIAIDESRCSEAREQGAQHTRTPESPEAIRIGIVGQIDEWKGHEDLIDALRILAEKREQFLLRIFGSGSREFAGRLRSKIEEYGLTNKVAWMGFIDDRKAIYEGMDVCVVPSRSSEPFGMVAAEAAIFGIPTVAARSGGLSEIVLENETGYLFDQRSTEQLAERLELLMHSRDLRRRIGTAAKARAKESLTSDRMVREMESLLMGQLDPRSTKGWE
jgi:glycosyltransferase involved in cell wall biosynthesis